MFGGRVGEGLENAERLMLLHVTLAFIMLVSVYESRLQFG